MPSQMEEADKAAAAVAKAPRVSLADIEAKIVGVNHFNLGEALDALGQPAIPTHFTVSMCVVTVNNGFTFIGKSAPADTKNFDKALGMKLAYEDALRQIWPMEGYLLRETLHRHGHERSPG